MSTIIRMQRPTQGDLSVVAQQLKQNLRRGELTGESRRNGSEGGAMMLNFEKYYFRNGSYAALSVMLTDLGVVQTADIVGSGGGEGIFNISLGANSEFAQDAAAILWKIGFRQE